MKWTSKEPTEPGWYWVKSYDGHVSVRHVVARAYGLRIIVRGREHEFGGFAEFAGPIPEPDPDEGGGLRLDNLRRRADPEALAKLDMFLAMCVADPLEIGFTIDAKTVHALFEIKEPFGLWRSRKLTHLKEFKDYARTDGKWLLSPDAAMVVAMGNPGKLGALYACYVACAVCERTEGKSPLEVFEEAHRYVDEIERLDRMME